MRACAFATRHSLLAARYSLLAMRARGSVPRPRAPAGIAPCGAVPRRRTRRHGAPRAAGRPATCGSGRRGRLTMATPAMAYYGLLWLYRW
eukprot:scaffold100381_cov66-Phaeocystis_antarctica.AAC.9